MSMRSGNSKHTTNFIGIAPSMRRHLRQNADKRNLKDIVVETVGESIQFQPRNTSQMQYYKSVGNPERKLGSDTMVSLHELAYSIPEYVWSIRTFPDMTVCFGIPSLLSLVQHCSSVFLSYDTTFNHGDFHLSVLTLAVNSSEFSSEIRNAFREWRLDPQRFSRLAVRSAAVFVTPCAVLL
jgi:hypothetical protein